MNRSVFFSSELSVLKIYPWIQLVKAPLCLSVALSAGLGFILYAGTFSIKTVVVVSATFLLACGAAGLNSLQETDVDARFERTRQRPLVTGEISPCQAWITTALCITLSLTLLYFTTRETTPLLPALLGPLVYNGIYTPLKHRTGFSLLIGSVAGALPPLIGWTCAGGTITDPRAVIIAIIFFLWQVPHFFIILLNHRQDYGKAGLCNLFSALGEQALRRVTLIWACSTATALIALSAAPLFLSTPSRIINCLAALVLLIINTYHLTIVKKANYRLLFHLLSTIFFGDMVLICAGELLTS